MKIVTIVQHSFIPTHPICESPIDERRHLSRRAAQCYVEKVGHWVSISIERSEGREIPRDFECFHEGVMAKARVRNVAMLDVRTRKNRGDSVNACRISRSYIPTVIPLVPSDEQH